MNDDLIFKASPTIKDFDTEIETSRIYEDKDGRSILEVNNSETSKTLYDINYLDVVSSDGASTVEVSLSEKIDLIRQSLYGNIVNTFKYIFGKSNSEIQDLFKMFKISVEITSEYPYYVSDLNYNQIISALESGNGVGLYGGWTLRKVESLSEGWDMLSWFKRFNDKSYGFDRNITAIRSSDGTFKVQRIEGVGLNMSFEPGNSNVKQGDKFEAIFEVYTGNVAETHVCTASNDTYTILKRFKIEADQRILDNVDFTFKVTAIEENAFDKYNIIITFNDATKNYTVANGKLTEKIISDTVREYTVKKEDLSDILYFIGCTVK